MASFLYVLVPQGILLIKITKYATNVLTNNTIIHQLVNVKIVLLVLKDASGEIML